jgi:hypothetical protein
MALQTYQIELKMDVGDEQHAAMSQAIKQVARDLLAVGMLLSGGKQPMIMCRSTDAFYDEAEINALDPNDLGL